MTSEGTLEPGREVRALRLRHAAGAILADRHSSLKTQGWGAFLNDLSDRWLPAVELTMDGCQGLTFYLQVSPMKYVLLLLLFFKTCFLTWLLPGLVCLENGVRLLLSGVLDHKGVKVWAPCENINLWTVPAKTWGAIAFSNKVMHLWSII